MAKDPAFLFYFQDFLVGTDDMDLVAVGAYIRCLCHQASKGSVSESHMRKICERQDVYAVVSLKFSRGENGCLVNERLQTEVEKRKAFSESRRLNRSKSNKSNSHMINTSVSYVPHMENENENVIENKDEVEKPKRERFQKPTFTEIKDFFSLTNTLANNIWKEDKVVAEAKKYFNYYEANGWKVGKNPMKDWKAAGRNWMNNNNKFDNNGHANEQQQNRAALTSLQARAREIIRNDGEATNPQQHSEYRSGE